MVQLQYKILLLSINKNHCTCFYKTSYHVGLALVQYFYSTLMHCVSQMWARRLYNPNILLVLLCYLNEKPLFILHFSNKFNQFDW